MKPRNTLPLRYGLATYTLCVNLIEHAWPYVRRGDVRHWRLWTDISSGKIVVEVEIDYQPALRVSENGAPGRAEYIKPRSPVSTPAARSIARTPSLPRAAARSRPHPGHAHSEDCYEAMDNVEKLSPSEQSYRRRLIALCCQIADEYREADEEDEE